MTIDQLDGYEPQEQGRRRYVWVGLGVVAAVIAVWSLTAGRPQAAPQPTPSPTPTHTNSVIATSTRPLQLQQVCVPVVSDEVLSVSFTLVNASETPAELTYIRPVLPMDGLVPLSTAVSPGQCQDSNLHEDPVTTVAPGGTVHVTFTLGLPEECPQPYPVGAEVTVAREGQDDERYGIAMYQDLGDVPFPTCSDS